MATDWLKRVLSSDKRDFCNFVPQLNEDMSKLFVQYFWLLNTGDNSKAKELLRKARGLWGMEPKHLNARPHGERLEPPRRKRAANLRAKRESSALPPKVTSGATVALSDHRDQCSNDTSDGAADIASAPAPEPSSHLISSPATGRRRTRPMEANRRGSKEKTRVAMRSLQERRSSAPTKLPAHSSTQTCTPSNFASSRAITELDRDLARIGAMAQECHVHDPFTPVYSFDNAVEKMFEDEEGPYDITLASEYSFTAYAGPEKGPEAAVFPKQLLPVTPPIWAEVRWVGCGCPNCVGNMLSSRDRKYASPLTPSRVFKEVFTIYTMWPKDTFLAGIPLCQFYSALPPNLLIN